MSKLIKVTQEYLDEVRKDFEEVLTSGKFSDGKITFTKTVGTINRKAKVLFTPDAWRKMQALVSDFDKEVAWHGVAYRGEDDSKDEYYITDILVYPQEVTGATVNTDQEKYEMWLMSHDDDVFNNIRMQKPSIANSLLAMQLLHCVRTATYRRRSMEIYPLLTSPKQRFMIKFGMTRPQKHAVYISMCLNRRL